MSRASRATELKALRQQAASIEERITLLAGEKRPEPIGRETLAAQIEELETNLVSGMYMDDDIDDDIDLDIDEDDDIDLYMDEDDDIDLDIDEDADEDYSEVDIEYCEASETKPGVEDQITQDYLSDVEVLEEVTDLADGNPSDVVSSNQSLHQASSRLDRLAAYCEKHGELDLALQVDRLGDRVDAQIASNLGGN